MSAGEDDAIPRAAGYTRLSQFAAAHTKDLLALHGVGPKSIRVRREALAERGLTFADEFELAQCLSFLAAAPDEAARLAKAGREYVLANYRWDIVLDAMEAGLQELLCASS